MSRCTDTCCRPEVEWDPEYAVLGSTTPRARKLYACDNCGGTIDTGAQHLKSLIREPGRSVATIRTHLWGCAYTLAAEAAEGSL